MAILANHISIDEATSQPGRNLKQLCRKLSSNLAELDVAFAAMDETLTGDGTSAAHFAITGAVYGVEAESGGGTINEKAQVMYDELNAAKTSAALRQFLAYMGP